MADNNEDVQVVDNPSMQRYEIRVGGELSGFAEYELTPGRIVFTHTEIDPSVEGRGIGSRLAAWALDDVAARGLSVTPSCPFIAGFIRRHPIYAGLVGRRDNRGG